MSTSESASILDSFSLDSRSLEKSSINAIRVALGISGVVALVIGVMITFWPKGTAAALVVLLGIYFIVAGLAYLGIGIFSRGISGGARAMDLILGVVLLVGGILALANLSATTSFLVVFLGLLIGIVWIIEGIVTLVQIGDAPSKGWAVFYGILGVLAGIVLLFSPVFGVVVLFVLTGIALIVLGIVQIVRAFTFGRGGGAVAATA